MHSIGYTGKTSLSIAVIRLPNLHNELPTPAKVGSKRESIQPQVRASWLAPAAVSIPSISQAIDQDRLAHTTAPEQVDDAEQNHRANKRDKQ